MLRAVLAVLMLVCGLSTARAAEVLVAVGRDLPPYVMVEDWRGLEYDIVREALALEGHTIKPKFMALVRVPKEMEAGLVDAAMTMRPDSGVQAFYSNPHVTYRNVVLTLASRNLIISRPADLTGKSVLAFQNAAHTLGPEFQAMAATNPAYREEARQGMQPLLLYLGRVDAVVSDRFIFGWFAHDPEVSERADTAQTLRVHAIFPPTDYSVAFRDAALRDSFNHGLRKLRESGGYGRIVERYSPYLKMEGGG